MGGTQLAHDSSAATSAPARLCRPLAAQGWLKTQSQYFYGANNSIQHANVNSIISATVLALLENPDRRFIEVEQAFFQQWWAEQAPAKQAAG